MINYESKYDKVLSAISLYSKSLMEITESINRLNQKYDDAYEEALLKHQVDIEEISKKIARTKAFVDMAASKTSQRIESEKALEYNSTAMSVLAAQINNNGNNDHLARKLYEEATGQLKFLKEVENELLQSSKTIQDKLGENKEIDESELYHKKRTIESKALSYIYSEEFTDFVNEIKNYNGYFSDWSEKIPDEILSEKYIGIGIKKSPFPLYGKIKDQISKVFSDIYDADKKTIDIPVCIDLNEGKRLFIEYTNESENVMLSGLHRMLLNIAKYYPNTFSQIIYIDPVRYNNNALGILHPLAVGKNSFIDKVPMTKEEIRKKISSVIENINYEETKSDTEYSDSIKRRLIIFNDFPNAYDADSISRIQQLFVNAEHYKMVVIATENISSKKTLSSEIVDYIKNVSQKIVIEKNNYFIDNNSEKIPFEWYECCDELSEEIRENLIINKPVTDTNNNYATRIGFDADVTLKKGIRKITDIPYSVDYEGNLLTLDFEDDKFATYLCGATRSGKSTLLHTLISGIVRNNHPDDIELWLIDFKMTEFSRYTENTPPHVRYILLDESPELVYDVIDRLTEIMTKRQNIFKGKWEKLSDVPADKYMPAIFVIIDEFSVMSQIIADSSTQLGDNYREKLQLLLAKGAAMGLHFIFSSQGFTNGTRGLSDYSKNQIQQRIAMKADFSEIKETLALKSPSDNDNAMIEQLPVHHTLVRRPVDERGDHLSYSKVLYIESKNEQEQFIKKIKKRFEPVLNKYDCEDIGVYVDKKPMIIDGDKYISFDNKKKEIANYIENYNNSSYGENETLLFIGEPRRMLPLSPVVVTDNFCENIIILSSPNQVVISASVIMSIAFSVHMQNKKIEIWSAQRNSILRNIPSYFTRHNVKTTADFNEICKRIHELKENISSKIPSDEFIVILGLDALIMDMNYLEKSEPTKSIVNIGEGRLKKGEMDLMTTIMGIRSGEIAYDVVDVQPNQNPEPESENVGYAYDAVEDINYILTYGPKLGYHFITAFNTTNEFTQTKLKIDIFKHRIIFRQSKSDLFGITNNYDSDIISKLEGHSFRYTDNLDSLSFRPFLHKGISWDGWLVDDSGSALNNAEEELLM